MFLRLSLSQQFQLHDFHQRKETNRHQHHRSPPRPQRHTRNFTPLVRTLSSKRLLFSSDDPATAHLLTGSNPGQRSRNDVREHSDGATNQAQRVSLSDHAISRNTIDRRPMTGAVAANGWLKVQMAAVQQSARLEVKSNRNYVRRASRRFYLRQSRLTVHVRQLL